MDEAIWLDGEIGYPDFAIENRNGNVVLVYAVAVLTNTRVQNVNNL